MGSHPFRTQSIKSVPPAEAQRMVEAGALLIDVRELDEFHQVRIAGAEFMPLSELGSTFGTIPTDRPVILYCRSGARSGQATAALTHQAGFTNLHNLEGGIIEWYEEGLPVSTDPIHLPDGRLPYHEADPEIANKDIENGELRWIVDVRPGLQYESGHLPGAVHIPLEQLPLRYAELPKAEPVLVTCDRGEISVLAARLLVDLDFTDVRVLEGGIEAWRYHELPLVSDVG